MPGLLYTLGAFALILVLNRLRTPLALAVLVGAAVIASRFGPGDWRVLGVLAQGAIQPRALGLAVITVLLLVISGVMQASGQLEEIVGLTKAVLRRPAVAMAALPALIGLLPMPAGALFSAPMVASAAGGEKVPGGLLSAVNYWFRHIWEHWWPLYPGVITAVALTGLDFPRFASTQAPLGVMMAGAGLLILRQVHPNLRAVLPAPARGTKRRLLWATSSIWVIVLIWVPVEAGFRIGGVRPPIENVPLAVGLAAALAWTVLFRRVGGRTVLGVFARRTIYELVALVLSVMVFQYSLNACDVPPRIGKELSDLRVPLEVVVAALPLIAGVVTGLAVGFVGTSFPIVLAVVRAMPEAGPIAPYVALAYAFGHLGQMLSPLHLCHVASNRYFETSFGPVYRRIVPAAVLTGLLTVAYFILLRAAMR